MAIDAKWLVQKFDYTAKSLMWSSNKPVYWDASDVNAFVDSDLGNDSTGDGTSTKPYKTLSKVKSIGATKWAAGKVIMCRGLFDEQILIDVAVKIIGAGGGICGRTTFISYFYISALVNTVLENLHIIYKSIQIIETATKDIRSVYAYNVLFENCIFLSAGYTGYSLTCYYYIYSCILHTCKFNLYASNNDRIYNRIIGNNNTFYNCSKNYSNVSVYFNGNNNHCNNSMTIDYDGGFNNIKNINGNYLDVNNYNFNFLNTSPLYHKGTYNPSTDNYNHVGAGTEGINKNAADTELIDTGAGGTATYTNLTDGGTEIYRTSVASNGILESGNIDLGAVRTRVILNLNYTYEYFNGTVYRRIQETDGRTVTQIFDCIIRYGEIEADLATCPDLLIEYGKLITVSGTGANRKGNADASFDPSDMIAIDSLYIRYIKFWLKLKTVV